MGGGGRGGEGRGLQEPAGESTSRPWSLPGAKPDWKVRCGWQVERAVEPGCDRRWTRIGVEGVILRWKIPELA